MAIPKTPEYALFRQPLDAAGRFVISERIGYLHLWRFEDIAGALALDGEVRVSFGGQVQDFVPLSYNTKIVFRPAVDRCIVEWDAQAGKRAVFLISANPDFLIGDNQPARQLVTSAAGTTIDAGNVVINPVAVQIRPANILRQSLIVQNISVGSVFLGPASVTVASGMELGPGAMIVLDKSSAAIYGITAIGGFDVRFFEELS